jgi:hypothetical protein
MVVLASALCLFLVAGGEGRAAPVRPQRIAGTRPQPARVHGSVHGFEGFRAGLKPAALIQGDGLVSADYKALLEGNGLAVTLIGASAVAATDFRNYRCILIAPDASPSEWTNDPTAARRIVGSGRPVVGLGQGGYAFFGTLGIILGAPHGHNGNGNSVRMAGGSSSPATQIYQEPVSLVAIKRESPDPNCIYLGRLPDDPSSYPIIGYSGLASECLLWGFDPGPTAMTEDGRRIFLRLVKKLAMTGGA